MTTYRSTTREAVIAQAATLEKRAATLRQEGDLAGAIAVLREAKSLHGDQYQDTRLAHYLQQAGRFDDAMQEIRWLIAHSHAWARSMFGHQPAAVMQRQRVGWIVRIHRDAAELCRQAQRPELQAEHERQEALYAGLLDKLKPMAEADEVALSEGWQQARLNGIQAIHDFLAKRQERIARNQKTKRRPLHGHAP